MKKSFISLIFATICSIGIAQSVTYITHTGSGTKDGLSWANALPADSIQRAIDRVPNNSQIWIGKGSYVITKAIKMRDSVAIFGGFTGTEKNIDERDFSDTTYFAGKNVNYIIRNDTVNYSAELNDITVMNADTAGIFSRGGLFKNCSAYNNEYGVISSGTFENCGMFGNRKSGVFVSKGQFLNCIIALNTISGVYNGSGLFNNCIISQNECYGITKSNGQFINCEISENARSGINESSCTFHGCTISKNLYYGCELSHDMFINCMIDNNETFGVFSCDGAFYNCVIANNTYAGVKSSQSTFVNCTIVKNTNYGFHSSSDTIRNCIIWGNTNTFTENAYLQRNAICENTNSNDYILLDTVNSSPTGPQFIDISNNNFQLSNYSPLINKGSNALNDTKTDMNEWTRIIGDSIDLGAYEHGIDMKISIYDHNGNALQNSPFIYNNTSVTSNYYGTVIVNTDKNQASQNFTLTSIYYSDTINVPFSIVDTSISFAVQFKKPKNITIRYVTTTGNGVKDGTSWSNAYPSSSLQNIIKTISLPGEIWVSQGTYTLNTPLVLRNGVAIYGGFKANETKRTERNYSSNSTVLWANNNNAAIYNTSKKNSSAIIDGFTISNGTNAGIISLGGLFKNCNITNNKGHGVYNSNATFISCNISKNLDCGIKKTYGEFFDCKISENTYSGIYESFATFINCKINKNTKSGIANSYAQFINCEICKNKAAGIYKGASTHINCTFANNLYELYESSSDFKNCIIWGNASWPINNNTFHHCAVSKANLSDENISIDTINSSLNGPHFVDPQSSNYQLQASSPCVNAGNDADVEQEFDIRNWKRIINQVDMGAYERGITAKFIVTDHNNNKLEHATITINGKIITSDSLGYAYFDEQSVSCTYSAQCINFEDSISGNFTLLHDTTIHLSFTKPKISNTVYVKQGANGFGHSWNDALGSIPAAIARCPKNGQIWIAKGNYSDSICLNANISILGGFVGIETSKEQRNPSINTTKLTASIVLKDVDSLAVIDGFTIAAHVTSNSGYVKNCTIQKTINSSQNSFFVNCSIVTPNDTISIRSNGGVFVNCIIGNSQYGVYNTNNTLFFNCIIKNNTIGVASNGGIFYNCNIINNVESGMYVGGNCIVKNTLIWGNKKEQIILIEASPKFGNCAIQDGYQPATGNLGKNINLNASNMTLNGPQLTNPDSVWTVLVTSPCINAGDKSLTLPYTDFYNNKRIIGQSVDIGVMEHQSPFDSTKPQGIIQNDTTICKSDTVFLDLHNATISDSIKWNTGEITNKIVVHPSQTSKYIVHYKIGLRQYVDSISIKTAAIANLGKDGEICDKASDLNPGTFKTYLWHDGKTTTSHAIDYTSAASYSVTVSDEIGCISSDTIKITKINPLPSVNLPNDTTICQGKTTRLRLPIAKTYKWSTNEKTQYIDISEEKKYIVTIENDYGCTNTDSVQAHILHPFKEQIGVVSYDSVEGKRIIIAWNRNKTHRTERYVVWRDNGAMGWDSIAGLRFNDSALVFDTEANLDIKPIKYKLETIDSVCHNRDSSIHRTMHVRANPQQGGMTISWEPYIGFNLKSYQIIRINPDNTITEIAKQSNDAVTFSVSDLSPINGGRYRVLYQLPEMVYPKQTKGDTGPFSQSFSNMSEASLVDDKQAKIHCNVKISPNPARDEVSIYCDATLSNQSIQLVDSKGTTFFVPTLYTSKNEIKISIKTLPIGLYTVLVPTLDNTFTPKLIVFE